KAFKKAAQAAYEKTGRKVLYLVNVTDGASTIMDTVKKAVEAGAEAIMINFAAVGYSMLQHIAGSVDVPVLAHCAGAGMFYEGVISGMSSPLAVGKLTRLAGADTVMVNTPYGGYPMLHQKYIQIVKQLTLPFYDIKPTMPSIGGGVHPGMVEKYIKELGNDIILAVGGAVQGHPMGAAAGANAMMQAINAVMAGISLEEAANEKEELAIALKLWGKR
ncbi:MAG TPA: RuBisCO large subunit C-terminal-like domain-containing protein, partial [Mobilitalea sp.]|nr:RuBisCO large subunit C-terminal-like domain-containing protein [Mobilitalea sp.]